MTNDLQTLAITIGVVIAISLLTAIAIQVIWIIKIRRETNEIINLTRKRMLENAQRRKTHIARHWDERNKP